MIDLFEIVHVVAALSLLLVAARVVGQIFDFIRQPRVIGEIIGGLLLGPTVLGWFAPEAMAWLFPKTGLVPTVLPIVSQIGLVLLMYASGTQLRPFAAAGEKKVVAALSLAGTLLPLLAGLAYVRFVDTSDLLGTAHNSTALMLVFATAIAIASIPVISRIMLDLGIMETSFARIVIATAVIDDLVLYMVLAVALSMVAAGGSSHGLAALLAIDPTSHWSAIVHVLATAGVIAVTLLAGPIFWRAVASRAQRLLQADRGIVAHVIFLAIVSGSCLLLAVNPMFGALVGGMVAGQALRRSGNSMPKSFERASLKFFVPLYFALVGARLDLIHHFDATYFVVFLAFACVVKALSIYAGARASGESHLASLNLAVALNARGGPGIVLAAVSFDAGIINENFYAILVLTAIVTSLAAGSWLGHVVRSRLPLRNASPDWKPAESAATTNQ